MEYTTNRTIFKKISPTPPSNHFVPAGFRSLSCISSPLIPNNNPSVKTKKNICLKSKNDKMTKTREKKTKIISNATYGCFLHTNSFSLDTLPFFYPMSLFSTSTRLFVKGMSAFFCDNTVTKKQWKNPLLLLLVHRCISCIPESCFILNLFKDHISSNPNNK